MPIPSHQNVITLLNQFRDKGNSRAGITNFQRDSKYRVLADVFSEEVIALREEQIRNSYSEQLANAQGKNLDAIGEARGCPRIKARHADVLESERNIAFFTESGNFGSLNGAQNIVLNGSEIISSDKNSNELNTSVDFQLTEPITLLANESVHYVSTRAINIGTESNVGAGVLRTHNFLNYSGVASSGLKVINFYPVLNGVDEEPDDLYRFRIANQYNRLITNNETRLKLTALNIPGIVNSRVEPGYFGIGTAGVFALGPENQANGRLVDSLQERLNSWKIPGGEYIAVPATQVEFDFEMQLNPSKPLTNQQLVRLKSDVNKAILEYFRQLSIGGVVDLKLMSQTIQRRLNTVAAFSGRGVDKRRLFKRVFVRKSYAGGPSDERSKVVAETYLLEKDEFPALGTLKIEVL